MSKRAEEKAKVFQDSLDYHQSMSMWPEEAYQKGYEQAEKDIITIMNINRANKRSTLTDIHCLSHSLFFNNIDDYDFRSNLLQGKSIGNC